MLHAFGDTSGSGISAAVYAVITQASGVSKGLIAAKSRLTKKNLTIPRLELVAAHMTANLVDNVRTALEGYPIKSVHGCTLDQRRHLQTIRDQQSPQDQVQGLH